MGRLFLKDRTRVLRTVALGLLIVCLGLPLVSQPVQAEGQRFAFVVGNAAYQELGPTQQLRNPVYDAQTMAATLKALGYQVIEKQNLGRRDFYQQWNAVLNQVTAEDTLVFFYSGHGVQIDGQNYLLPSDIPYLKHGRSLQVKRESISVSELLLDLRTGDRDPPKVTVMILDACRDDPLALNKSVAGGLASMYPPEGTFLMFSAAAGETALDYLGPTDPVQNSVYTRKLVPLLRQPNLTLPEVARTVRREVAALAQTYRKHQQRPGYVDELIGRFCLAGCQAAVPEEPEALPSVAAVPVPALAPPPVDPAPIVKKTPGVQEPAMVRIPGGTITMGSNEGNSYERPPHQVTIQDFYLGKYEVTFAEYDQFAQATGRSLPKDEGWGRGRRPVMVVSWDEAKDYAAWLSEATGKRYRLPTEAEWEYAARSGSQQDTWAGTSQERELGNYAVYRADKTAEVGSKQPNALGLHDLSGNVWEWVEDCWHKSYDNAPPTDGTAWLDAGGGKCGQRVFRGGSWYNNAPVTLRSSYRDRFSTGIRLNYIGFRLAQDIP